MRYIQKLPASELDYYETFLVKWTRKNKRWLELPAWPPGQGLGSGQSASELCQRPHLHKGKASWLVVRVLSAWNSCVMHPDAEGISVDLHHPSALVHTQPPSWKKSTIIIGLKGDILPGLELKRDSSVSLKLCCDPLQSTLLGVS